MSYDLVAKSVIWEASYRLLVVIKWKDECSNLGDNPLISQQSDIEILKLETIYSEEESAKWP